MSGHEAAVLIVRGLRDHVPHHWRTLSASRLPRPRTVAPIRRSNPDCAARVEAIETQAAAIRDHMSSRTALASLPRRLPAVAG
jgi:predicted alpha/beta hydrolase family esterase